MVGRYTAESRPNHSKRREAEKGRNKTAAKRLKLHEAK